MNMPKKSQCLLLFLFALCYTVSGTAKAETAEQKAAVCFGCHGQNGDSKNPQFPKLAGQQPKYLASQLTAFRDGSRKGPMMQGMVSSLTDEDISALATYFASKQATIAGGDSKLAAEGKQKFSQCMGCHGASAEGRGIFPRLAGQQPAYIASQLQNFKQGTRKSGPMQAVAAGLTDDDINALAAYLGTLK